jgi:acylphosphatase
MVHKKILIKGSVQGVGFRYATRKVADQYNINGFVRNLPDGNVYVEAEGTEAQVEEFIRWCHIGPPHARIVSVFVEEGPLVHFSNFTVTF